MNMPILHKKEWNLTQESFEKFLHWLDPNPDEAGKKYEDIRRRLIKIFACRGCTCPEDLSDETINRVIHKIQEIADSYSGNRALYFYGVANYVHHEHVRKRPVLPAPVELGRHSRREEEFECLDQCIEGLLPRSKALVMRYYQEEKQAKIDSRKQLAIKLGIPMNALRIRAYRIRMNLQTCMFECLHGKAEK